MSKLSLNAQYQREYRKDKFVFYQRLQKSDYDRLYNYAKDIKVSTKSIFVNGINSLYKKTKGYEFNEKAIQGLSIKQLWQTTMNEEPSDVGVSWTIELRDKDKLDYITQELGVSYKEILVYIIRESIPLPYEE